MENNDKSGEVAIIVPCFNQGKYLEDCLNSVLSQTYTNWVCIVIDDGSTDDTFTITKTFQKINQKVHYHFQENQGLPSARNTGISITSSEFILPLDADDYLHTEYLEKTINASRLHPQVKVVYTNVSYFGSINGPMTLRDYSYQELLKGNLITATALFKRADYYKTNGYDQNLRYGLEDWEFWISLLQPEDQVLKLNETLFFYRRKINSMVESITPDRAHQIRKYIYLKHFETYRDLFEDPLNLYHKVRSLEKENRHLRNKDLETRIRRRFGALKEYLYRNKP